MENTSVEVRLLNQNTMYTVYVGVHIRLEKLNCP